MAFKLKGMTFGKGTGYKSPQMMKKESAMKMAKKSPMKMAKKSPNKLNKGFDKLPAEVQKKILKKK